MRPWLVCRIAPIIIALSACAGSLQTSPDIVRTDALSEALQGATYSLPRLDYQVTVTRYLSSCPGDMVDGKATQLDFALDAKAKSSYQRGETFRVDFSKIGGIARTGKFSIETYPNGTLKSIGASGEDQTGQIIQDLTKTALSAWAAVQTGGASVAAGAGYEALTSEIMGLDQTKAVPRPSYQIVCKPATKSLLAAMQATAKEIERQTGKVESVKHEIDAMSSRASLKLLTKTDRERLSSRFAELDQLDAQLRALSKLLNAQKKVLGIASEVAWKTDYASRFDAQTLAVNLDAEDQAHLAALFDLVPAGSSPPPAGSDHVTSSCYGERASPSACVADMIETRMAFATDEPIMIKCADGQSQCFQRPAGRDSARNAYDAQSDPGIFVRDPVIARMLLCFKRSGDRCTLDNDLAGLEPQFTPQLGQLRFIPFKVRPFEGRSFALQMSEEGRVSKLEYSTDKAMLATAAASAANVSAQVAAALDQRETKRRGDEEYRHKMAAQNAQDQVDRLNRQIALKEATAKLASDPLQSVKTQTVGLEAQRALAEAQVARIEAEQKLERLLNPAP